MPIYKKIKKIALIGQVNVGKSTLFNALISERKAIVSLIPGTTRDRNYGICQWNGQEMAIIDTGGVEEKRASDELEKGTIDQINKALAEADLVFFIVDIRPLQELESVPLSNFEKQIAQLINRSKKPRFLILNKADNPEKRQWAEDREWQNLGFGKPFAVSAVNGTGLGDLLDRTVDFLFNKSDLIKPEEDENFDEKEIYKVAIIGRPNVGKSTLLNGLLGEEKAIVSSFPHTTRGPQDTLILYKNQPVLLIDTAGIRQKRKIGPGIEKLGVLKTLETIKKSDLALLVVDIFQDVQHQDKALAKIALKNKKSLIFIINKCDLEDNPELKLALPIITWAPRLFISAKQKKNINQILPLIKKIKENQNRIISQENLNIFLKKVILEKGWPDKIWEKIELKQKKFNPPEFELKTPKIFIRRKQIHQAQLNIIKKEMRRRWRFDGVPIEVSISA